MFMYSQECGELNAQRTTVPVATFSTLLSNIANEWCASAADATSSEAIRLNDNDRNTLISYSFPAGSAVL